MVKTKFLVSIFLINPHFPRNASFVGMGKWKVTDKELGSGGLRKAEFHLCSSVCDFILNRVW